MQKIDQFLRARNAFIVLAKSCELNYKNKNLSLIY